MKCASCRCYDEPANYIKGCRTIKTCLKCRKRGLQKRTKDKECTTSPPVVPIPPDVPKNPIPPIIPVIPDVPKNPICLKKNAMNFKSFLSDILVTRVDVFNVTSGEYTLEQKVVELIKDDYALLTDKPFHIFNKKKKIIQVKGREWIKLELDDPVFRELIQILVKKLGEIDWEAFETLFLSTTWI